MWFWLKLVQEINIISTPPLSSSTQTPHNVLTVHDLLGGAILHRLHKMCMVVKGSLASSKLNDNGRMRDGHCQSSSLSKNKFVSLLLEGDFARAIVGPNKPLLN